MKGSTVTVRVATTVCVFMLQVKCFSPLEDVRIGAGEQLPGQWVTGVLSARVNVPACATDRHLRLVLSGRIGRAVL